MKTKAVIVVLVVACVGLGIAFFATKKSADDQHATDVNSIVEYSNQVVTASRLLDELGQVNLTLSNDLTSSQQRLALSTDQLAQLSNHLANADAALTDTKTMLAGAQEQVTNLNTRITDLEAQNKVLDQQAVAMADKLAQLAAQIENTQNQLAIAETNRAFLQGELQKQLAQKAELEHKFNDLDELRAQVRNLKDELFVARRLRWMKDDTSGKKGAELLKQRNLSAPSPSSSQPSPAYDLNVEVGSDGSVKVIPPLGATNNPAH